MSDEAKLKKRVSNLRGCLEICQAHRVSGWAIEGDLPAEVDLFVNGARVGSVACDQPREDVRAASGIANAGFCYQPSPQRLPPAARVSIRSQDGTELGNSPGEVPRHEGHVDACTGATISGWAAWDGLPAELCVQVDGKPFDRIRCSLPRPDVAETLGLPVNTGFDHNFPALPPNNAVLSVCFPDGTALFEQRVEYRDLDLLTEELYDATLQAHRRHIEEALEKIQADLRIAEDRPGHTSDPTQLRAMRDILSSGLFDTDFYLRDNPDVAQSGEDPLRHYVFFGDEEGRRPNLVFWPREYRLLNDVPDGANALVHYALEGERRGYRASLAFDSGMYIAANSPLAKIVGRPMFHYLRIGLAAGFPVRSFAPYIPPRRLKSRLRIAAQLGVKDEAEILEQSISHLRAIGIDHIIAIDVASTDGSLDILEKHRSADFQIIRLTDRATSADATAEDDQTWEVYKTAPADWVIFLDPDEFWLPASGNLKECEALDLLDVLSVRRYNIPVGPEGASIPTDLDPRKYGDIPLIAKPLPDIRNKIIRNPDTPWIMGVEEPKIMARPEKASTMIAWSHDVAETGGSLRRAVASDLLIAHLPLSTKKRFERKIANIRAVFERDGIDLFAGAETWQSNAISWHWRRWAALAQEGMMEAELRRNILTEPHMSEMRRSGIIQSAAELLAKGITVPPQT